MNRLEEYLWYVDEALDQMTAILVGLGDELACTRPNLPGANAPYAIVTHCCGVMEQWGGEMVAGRRVQRDRVGSDPAGRLEDLQAVAATGVHDVLAGVQGPTRGQLCHDVVEHVVGHRQHEHVTGPSDRGRLRDDDARQQVVDATERGVGLAGHRDDLVATRAERGGEHGTDSTGTDHAHPEWGHGFPCVQVPPTTLG